MEINGNTVGLSGSNSSNEDLSQYTDADESMSAPTEILAEVNYKYYRLIPQHIIYQKRH